jgi:hypothetical protein
MVIHPSLSYPRCRKPPYRSRLLNVIDHQLKPFNVDTLTSIAQASGFMTDTDITTSKSLKEDLSQAVHGYEEGKKG